jgi:hypothetical protein
MNRRKTFKHGKEVGLKIAQWSEDDTQFPAAWPDALKLVAGINGERVIGFKMEVWLAPQQKEQPK